ncbi:hypothetical protein K438DRAFT_1937522, partial [Mycena galopus ATCC 62051]
MIFKPAVYLAACAFFAVSVALPSSNVNVARLAPTGPPVTIVNAANNATIFTFSGPAPLQVLQPQIWPWEYGTWNRYKLSTDTWIFQNTGTQQWLSVDQSNNQLVTVAAKSGATTFAVDSAGGGQYVIKLPNVDEVAQTIYTGASMEYGEVALAPANGGDS